MKIFISYAHEDQDYALKIYNDLLDANLNPWLDVEKILPGQNWKTIVTKAIQESSFFIALLSSNSISRKGYMQKELKIAFNFVEELPVNEIFIIPVRIDECILFDEKLKELHWVDMFRSYENAIKKIISVIIEKKCKKNNIICNNIEENLDNSNDTIKNQKLLKFPKFGNWVGNWTSPKGYLFECNIQLSFESDNKARGKIDWTLQRAPNTILKTKVGSQAVEYLIGTYSAKERLIEVRGYDKNDPDGIIAQDFYRLKMSKDNLVIRGETQYWGDWQGAIIANSIAVN